MNIGDKVRLLHSKEEGIVIKILENNLIEISIEGDFTIPVLRKEVVLVSPEESKAFGKSSESPQVSSVSEPVRVGEAISSTGVYYGFVVKTGDLLELNLINNTDFDLLFTFGEEVQKNYKGLCNDKLKSRSSRMLGHYDLKSFDKWPEFVIQYILHRAGHFGIFESVVKKQKFKAASLHSAKKVAPVIRKDAYLFQIDVKTEAIDVSRLKEQLLDSEISKKEKIDVTAPKKEVDLHIEKLVDDFSTMSKGEIMKRQLEVFEESLDKAIAVGMDEIVFIHGVGNGALRLEIQKRLSKNKKIRYYEDAKRENFGYGATLARLK